MDLPGRIEYIMKVNQLSASAFAEKIGVQRSSISHILSGRNKPSLDFITRVLENFPRVNAEWLLTGNTNVSDKDDEGPDKSPSGAGNNQGPAVSKGNKEIQRILVFYKDSSFEEFFPG